jgi:cytidine deaminase
MARRHGPWGDMDDAEAAAILAKLSSAPARPAQLAHKPDKLATCGSCRGVLNEQTGECKCSD